MVIRFKGTKSRDSSIIMAILIKIRSLPLVTEVNLVRSQINQFKSSDLPLSSLMTLPRANVLAALREKVRQKDPAPNCQRLK